MSAIKSSFRKRLSEARGSRGGGVWGGAESEEGESSEEEEGVERLMRAKREQGGTRKRQHVDLPDGEHVGERGGEGEREGGREGVTLISRSVRVWLVRLRGRVSSECTSQSCICAAFMLALSLSFSLSLSLSLSLSAVDVTHKKQPRRKLLHSDDSEESS